MLNIDWESAESAVLINPRLPNIDGDALFKTLSKAPLESSHLWLGTSGSSGTIKWVALSKQAILSSAQAVNIFLQSSAQDVWLNALPQFHVGGLGIWVRSHLSGARVIDLYGQQNGTWDAAAFHAAAHAHQVTLSSLVPAQVYDLVHLNLQAPPSLRAIIVGGGALSESLRQNGQNLGWNLLPSYGLTECASQVATWRHAGLEILPHVKLRISEKGFIELHSSALFSLYALQTSEGMQFIDPKLDGWFTTEDVGYLESPYLHLLGRQGNFIKIGGESVDLSRLEHIIEESQTELRHKCDLALIPYPDPRLGHVIHLATVQHPELKSIIDLYNSRVLPFEKIRFVHYLQSIPRSPLQKVLKNELMDLITNAHSYS